MTDDPLDILRRALSMPLENSEHVAAALTHSSAGTDRNYERLEFLGDRVVNLVMARILFETFPDEDEGDLAKRHAALVQGSMMASIARRIGLGAALTLSEAERAAGGEENENILADSLEAFLGAFFLDRGLETCRDAIVRLWGDSIHIMKEPPQDPKTTLQEWAQGRGLPLPVYDMTDRQGPDHAPLFTIRVTVQGFSPAAATGYSRRAAEKEAARLLLVELGEDF